MGTRITPAKGSKSDKLWRNALLRAAKRRLGDKKDAPHLLDLAATKVVEAAVGGDIQAAKELGDRLDGRPAQALVSEDSKGNRVPVTFAMYLADGKPGH